MKARSQLEPSLVVASKDADQFRKLKKKSLYCFVFKLYNCDQHKYNTAFTDTACSSSTCETALPFYTHQTVISYLSNLKIPYLLQYKHLFPEISVRKDGYMPYKKISFFNRQLKTLMLINGLHAMELNMCSNTCTIHSSGCTLSCGRYLTFVCMPMFPWHTDNLAPQ